MQEIIKDGNSIRRTRYFFAGLLLLFSLGCTARNTLHIIPLNYNTVSTNYPLLIKVNPDECYYWVNKEDEICIVMKKKSFSLLGEAFERELHLSLVLSGQPAGSARSYRATRKTMRNRYRHGYASSRSTSLTGIIAIWDYKKDSLHGRFRIVARQQVYSILSGWGNRQNVLFVGEFVARKNKDKGMHILTYTEEDELSRKINPAAPQPVNGPPRNHTHQNHPPQIHPPNVTRTPKKP